MGLGLALLRVVSVVGLGLALAQQPLVGGGARASEQAGSRTAKGAKQQYMGCVRTRTRVSLCQHGLPTQ